MNDGGAAEPVARSRTDWADFGCRRVRIKFA